MKNKIKSLLANKFATLASRKIISLAVAGTIVAGAATGAVIAVNHASNENIKHQAVAVSNDKVKVKSNINKDDSSVKESSINKDESKVVAETEEANKDVAKDTAVDKPNSNASNKAQVQPKAPASATSSAKPANGASTATSTNKSSSNGGSTTPTVASLPSPAQLEAKYSYYNRRVKAEYSDDIYNQFDSIYSTYLNDKNASKATAAMFKINLSINNGLYTNIRVRSGGCGSSIIRPGMGDIDIQTAIASAAPGAMYFKFHIVSNGDGTDTVYAIGANITAD